MEKRSLILSFWISNADTVFESWFWDQCQGDNFHALICKHSQIFFCFVVNLLSAIIIVIAIFIIYWAILRYSPIERTVHVRQVVWMLSSIKGFILEPYNFSINPGIWSAIRLVKTILNPLESVPAGQSSGRIFRKVKSAKIYSDRVPSIA